MLVLILKLLPIQIKILIVILIRIIVYFLLLISGNTDTNVIGNTNINDTNTTTRTSIINNSCGNAKTYTNGHIIARINTKIIRAAIYNHIQYEYKKEYRSNMQLNNNSCRIICPG